MTLLKPIPVDSLEKSPLNERLVDDNPDDEEFAELVTSIEAVGDVNDPLLVRPAESGYEVIKGSRRMEAARQADGVTEIRCEVDDIDDGEALLRTITDNINSFKKDISPRERALSLYNLWDEMGTTKNPSATALADILGVTHGTVSKWLEPLSDEWEDTVINPLSNDGQDVRGEHSVRNLSPRKLRSIRKATGGGEAGIALAEKTVEHSLTVQDLAQVRQHMESGASMESAVGVVIGELSLEEVAEETGESVEEPEADTSQDHGKTPTAGSERLTPQSSFRQKATVSSDGGTSTDSSPSTSTDTDSSPSPSAPSTTDTPTTTADVATETASNPASSLPNRYQNRDLVAGPDEIEQVSETRGTATILAGSGEDEEGGDSTDEEPVEVSFTLTGTQAAAARAAIDHHAAEDAGDLGKVALLRFLKEGHWLQ